MYYPKADMSYIKKFVQNPNSIDSISGEIELEK